MSDNTRLNKHNDEKVCDIIKKHLIAMYEDINKSNGELHGRDLHYAVLYNLEDFHTQRSVFGMDSVHI